MGNSDHDKTPPAGTGESTSRRGEDIAKTHKEPGRVDMGHDDTPAARPAGGSTEQLHTGLKPDEKQNA